MKNLHLICNAHIDPVWQWTWDEGISSAISTFKSAADLADEFDYIFCHGESLLYETIEKNVPALFQKIQHLVKIGKWHISGGWYIQPDCLMPCGETIKRNIEEGRRYFKEKFGVTPTVATNFDSFGHSIGLVQIMAKARFKGYLICRPKKDVQIEYPSRFFKWISPDGSSVIASYSETYNSLLGKAAEKITKEIGGKAVGMLGAESSGKENKTLNDVDYVLWGVGNHGGGPSRKDLQDIKNLEIKDYNIIHSTPEDLFDDDIEVKGELKSSLVTCMPGCYSSMARIKQAYRRTENMFYATEKMISAAILNGFRPDMRDFKEAEKKLLLATFHDILPGTCIADGEREGLGLLAACEKTLRDYRTNAFLYLVMGKPCAKIGEFPVFVFNYAAYETESIIETEFSLADQNWDENVVYVPHIYDKNGMELPCQQIKENSNLNLDWRKRIIFKGRLKPLAITRFTIKVTAESKIKKQAKSTDLNLTLKDNILLDKSAVLETYDDTADPWGMSDKELISLGDNPVYFRLMDENEIRDFCAVKESVSPVREIENGDVLKCVEGIYTNGNSNAVLQYRIFKNEPYADIKTIIEFTDKNKLVRLKLPIPDEFKGGTVVGDGPYVWEEKPVKGEITFQKWIGIKKGDKIFSVINDGVYAGKTDGEYLYITLLRGSGYCVHPIGERELYPQDRYLPRIDCGRYEYNFRIFSGDIYEVCKMAEEFNNPPYALNIFPAGGKEKNDLNISVMDNIIISSAITCENDESKITAYNPSDKIVNFTIKAGKKTLSGNLSAKEFKIIKL